MYALLIIMLLILLLLCIQNNSAFTDYIFDGFDGAGLSAKTAHETLNAKTQARPQTKPSPKINVIKFINKTYDNSDYKNMPLAETNLAQANSITFDGFIDIDIIINTRYNQINMPRFYLDLKADKNEDYVFRINHTLLCPDENGTIKITLKNLNYKSINPYYVNNIKNYINYGKNATNSGKNVTNSGKNATGTPTVIYSWVATSNYLADTKALDYNPLFLDSFEFMITEKADPNIKKTLVVSPMPMPMPMPQKTITAPIKQSNVDITKETLELKSTSPDKLLNIVTTSPHVLITLATVAPEKLSELVAYSPKVLKKIAASPPTISALAISSPKTLAYFTATSPDLLKAIAPPSSSPSSSPANVSPEVSKYNVKFIIVYSILISVCGISLLILAK